MSNAQKYYYIGHVYDTASIPEDIGRRARGMEVANEAYGHARGSAPGRTSDDYRRGVSAEILLRMSCGLSVEGCLTTSLNFHAPDIDLPEWGKCDIKTEARGSWVTQDTDRDSDRWVFLFSTAPDRWWDLGGTITLLHAIRKDAFLGIARPMRNGNPTKRAVYEMDLWLEYGAPAR